MKTGRSLVDLAQELTRQLASKRDMIVPSRMVTCSTAQDNVCRLIVNEPDGLREYPTTDLARRQLAEKLKIPFAYFERMREEKPDLLDRNVNDWLASESEQRMLRTLDGRVRAVLSNRYRRMDNYDLAEHVIPVLMALPEARLESADVTETKMYLKVVTPAISRDLGVGDIVQAGVVVSNSEVGCGTLSVQPLIFRLVCKNGLIVPDRALRKTHLGRINSAEDDLVSIFNDDTLQADDKAFFLKVRDVVKAAVSEATFLQISEKMQATIGIKLTGDPVKSVTVLASRFGLNDDERSGVLRHLIEDGDLSAYGLVNAVTHQSQQIDSYDRATELEMLGGRLIELSRNEWKEMAEA